MSRDTRSGPNHARRLMAVLAHPDDEALGFGGTLAAYAARGVEVHLLTATRGEGGRHGEFRAGEAGHPGAAALGAIREGELRASAAVLGIRDVSLLGYCDQHLDWADPREVVGAIAAHLRRVRPQVVLTFGPDGAYGHPDHIAISQYTTAAIVAAASTERLDAGVDVDPPHRVSKLYYIAWPSSTWDVYQAVFKKLVSVVDGVERRAVPWPDWAITTAIDARSVAPTVLRAVSCHASQVSVYAALQHLSMDQHDSLWGRQYFYRAYSAVNGGRTRETDLFEGIAPPA